MSMDNIFSNNNNEIFNNGSNKNIQSNNSGKSLSCWNCSNLFFSNNNERVAQCPKCHKYNHIPNLSKSANLNHIFTTSLNNLENNRTIENSEKIISCPFCNTKNLFQSDAEELICYKCGKNIKMEFSNSFQLNLGNQYNQLNKNIIGWRIVPSQQSFIAPPTPLPPNPITPYSESNTDYLLKKILKNIKKQKNVKEFNNIQPPNYSFVHTPNFIPFPIVDYYNNRRINYMDSYLDGEKNNNAHISEIRYLPIKTEKEKPKKEGYKITIRKKNKNSNGLSKSTIFEKVFYLK